MSCLSQHLGTKVLSGQSRAHEKAKMLSPRKEQSTWGIGREGEEGAYEAVWLTGQRASQSGSRLSSVIVIAPCQRKHPSPSSQALRKVDHTYKYCAIVSMCERACGN